MHLPVPDDNDAKKLLNDLLEGSLGEAEQPPSTAGEDAGEAAPEPPDSQQEQRAAERAGDGEVAGYSGPYATPEERANLGRDRTLVGKLTSHARKQGLRQADAEDVVQEALTSASLAARLPGGSGKARNRYVFGVLGYKIAEHWRKTYQEGELNERAAEHFARPVTAVDPVADRDLLAKLPMLVKPGQLEDLRCLLRYRIGNEPLKTLALERGEDYEAFAKRIRRLWSSLQAMVGAMTMALLALLFHPRPDRPLGYDAPGPIPSPEAAVSTHVGQVDPIDRAAAVRGAAFRACMNDRWWECLEGLDTARDLDPSGDTDPVVVAARKDATEGYAAGLKPGGTWRPPVVRAYADRASR
jgi:DNA-directed RNA polymerase specialized sigma24 family protein